MRGCIYLFHSLLLCFITGLAIAQPMNGQVVDLADKTPISGVIVANITSNSTASSSPDGKFTVVVDKGQLIELKKQGYKTMRFRVPEGNLPPYFMLGLEKQKPEAPQGNIPPANYTEDSIRYYSLYKHELEFPRLTGMQAVAHPFSALSKRNRQIWAFQEEFDWFQKEKYINYTFNETLVTNLTGLKGDSLQNYMHIFRPDYEQLRSMSEYNFYTYIRLTADQYRKTGRRYRPSPSRSGR